jgi:two-component sensor histidine kinase
VERIRKAVEQEVDLHVEVMNYRKDGTPFWNSLFLSPVRNAKGEVKFFFGSQIDVSDKKQTESDLHSVNDELRETKTLLEQQIDDRTSELMRLLSQRSRLVNELDHRVKNNLQIISSLLGFELRRDLAPETRAVINRLHQRIDALGLAHKDQHNKEAIGYFRVDNFVRVLIGKILANHPRWPDHPHYELEEVLLPIGKAAPLSLALNEFARALLEGDEDESDKQSELRVTVQTRNGTLVLTISSENLTQDHCQRAFSGIESWTTRLLEKQLEARIDFIDQDGRCGVRLALPLDGTHHDD